MRIDTLKYFYERSIGQNPSFFYRGPFLDKFTNTILEVSKGARGHGAQDGNISKKVSFMLVECFQNILKHAENISSIEHLRCDEGMFSFKSMQGAFVINSINVIQNNEIEKLSALVAQVNSLSETDLKQYYLNHLQNNTLSEKGGAGLGLIEMARKSGQKILHNIESLDEKFSLFHQQITLLRGENRNDENFSHQLGESRAYYKKMIEEKFLLLYKGDFSQKSILPLLEIVEHNVGEKQGADRRSQKAAHVLVEVLQNISKHATLANGAESRSGIFMLGKENGSLFILAGNLVSVSEKIVLEEKLEYLSSLDNEELRELHKNTMRATLRFENKNNSGLGLIEVAKASTEALKYQFFPFGYNQFLFALEVSI